MFKKYLRVFIMLMLPIGSGAQSLTVSVQGNTSGTGASAFTLAEGQVSFESSQVRFLESGVLVSNFLDYGVSPDRSVVGFLVSRQDVSRALVMDSEGDTLSSFSVTELSSGDPSVAMYPVNTGGVLVRDNIASFSFYDSFGKILTQVSSSSQSLEGEAISEVAMDPAARTVVIYNPQIKRNGNLGSQAQVMDASNRLEHIYSSPDKIIKDVVVSGDGQFIVLLTGSEGSGDEVVIMDRFGNELNVISTDEDVKGAALSEDAEYLTLFSERRILVFNTLEGERLGSTSLRSPLLAANYFSQDGVILGMTGELSSATDIADNIEFHAIHLGKRQVVRESFGSPIEFNEAIRHDLARMSTGQYRLEGASIPVVIHADF